MKKFFKVLLITVAAIVILLVGSFFYVKSLPVPAVQIEDTDLNAIGDGFYTGEYDTELVKAAVEVNVADHRITSIKIIKHECGLGKKAEIITESIINSQSLQVDTISGATQSSNVILKAVENALQNGKI